MTADWARLPHELAGAHLLAHRQRSARREPRRVRYHDETARHRRVGVDACAFSSSVTARARTRFRGGSRSRRRAKRSSRPPEMPGPHRAERIGRSPRRTERRWPTAASPRRIDLAVLGPETAIAAGVGDRLREAGIAVFGPNRSGGRLESSKMFAKRFMERHGIPTARAVVVHSLDAAHKALDEWAGAVVVKADGLAAGKGVVVAPDVGRGARRPRRLVWRGMRSSRRRIRRSARGAPCRARGQRLRALRRTRNRSDWRRVRLQARRRRRHRAEYRRHGRILAARGFPGRSGRSRARANSRAAAARAARRRRRVYRRALLRVDVERRRAAGHRVQRALRRSGDAGADAAHRRRLCGAASVGRERRDGSVAATTSPQHCVGVVLATAIIRAATRRCKA